MQRATLQRRGDELRPLKPAETLRLLQLLAMVHGEDFGNRQVYSSPAFNVSRKIWRTRFRRGTNFVDRARDK